MLRGLESSLYMAVWAAHTHHKPGKFNYCDNYYKVRTLHTSSGLWSSSPSPGSCMIKKVGIGWQLIRRWILIQNTASPHQYFSRQHFEEGEKVVSISEVLEQVSDISSGLKHKCRE